MNLTICQSTSLTFSAIGAELLTIYDRGFHFGSNLYATYTTDSSSNYSLIY